MEKLNWVMDYECMSNLFLGVFVEYTSEKKKVFVIHELKNDVGELIIFLKDCSKSKSRHISFNGINYDSQMTEFLLKNEALFLKLSAKDITTMLYHQSQVVIQARFPDIPEWKLSIPQIDVYKLNHWDNVNKMCSLYWRTLNHFNSGNILRALTTNYKQ